MTVLIYVQYLVGIGHLKRALILARSMRQRGLNVVVASGGPPVAVFEADPIHQLPPAHCHPGDFSNLLDGNGQPVTDAWRKRRARELVELVKATRPDCFVVETFPFGRRQFRFELSPVLEALSSARPRPKMICSIRDIVQQKSSQREREITGYIDRYFDQIWVHGDPRVVDLGVSFSQVDRIREKIRYTGYIAEPWSADPNKRGNEILVSAGGSAAGAPLVYRAAELASSGSSDGRRWRFLLGAGFSSGQILELKSRVKGRGTVEPLRRDYRELLSACGASISQFGYNTAVDIVQTGTRAVVVPYQGDGETEQLTRSRYFEDLGAVVVVREDELTPAALEQAIKRTCAEVIAPPSIDLDGADRAAAITLGESRGL